MPTFVFDIYKDWTPEELKARCLELGRIACRNERIIAMMAGCADALEKLPPKYRERAMALNAAYRDDEQDDAEAAAAGIQVISFEP